MTFLVWTLALLFAAALAFTIYYQIIVRVFHIELRAREIHTVLTPDGWRIRLFRYRKGGTSGEPVLLVHGYTSNHWNLTLPQGESLADFLAEKGYDCWAIDLRGNRTSLPPPGTPRHRATYDGYVMGDLPAAISFIRQSTGYDQVHWVGHSMGGMLLYAYELAHGRGHIASGVTIASPPWLEAFWPKSHDRLVWLMEAAPFFFETGKRAMTPAFAWLKPNSPLVPVRWENLNPKFGIAEFFNATEQTALPVTRAFEDCAKHRYLAVDSDRVNVLQGLNRLEAPLLVMACPLDPIAPVATIQSFFDRLPSKDKRLLVLSQAEGCAMDHSHVDPPFARHAVAEVFTPIADWFAAHPARRANGVPAAIVVAEPKPAAAPPKAWPKPVENADADALSGTSWGKVLKNAANILSGLEGNGTDAEASPVVSTKSRPAARKRSTKSRAKAVASKKSSTKKKVSTKAKKAAAAPAKPVESRSSQKSAPVAHAKPAKEDVNGLPKADAKAPARKRSTKAKAGRNRAAKEPE